MMRMLWRSVRLGIVFSSAVRRGTPRRWELLGGVHQFHEVREQRRHIAGTGARLRMTLEAERRPVGAMNALQSAVEQRAMGRAQIGRQRGFIDRKTVVL